jgi:hypothetical protein
MRSKSPDGGDTKPSNLMDGRQPEQRAVLTAGEPPVYSQLTAPK